MTQHEEEAPKLHVDADWKAEAQREKERLAEQEQERADQPPETPGELPPPDFKAILGLLASQAIGGLGAYGDQKTGRVMIDLVGAKYFIDLLAILQEKTAGNLSDEESTEVAQVVTELRARFVQVAQMVAQQDVTAAGGAAQTSEPEQKLVMPE